MTSARSGRSMPRRRLVFGEAVGADENDGRILQIVDC
jgi:hypothetical protein